MPLACIVREFQDGHSPEAIRSAFPTLTLEQVYGAMTFYLGHRHDVDANLAARERAEDTFIETHPVPAHLKEKLEYARRQRHSREGTRVMTMKAIELIGDVDEQHRLHAQVPTEIPVGQVRLIVFLPGEDETDSLWARGVASEWSAELSDPREDLYTLDDGPPVHATR